jgi:molybdate transport system substrate-binding protein
MKQAILALALFSLLASCRVPVISEGLQDVVYVSAAISLSRALTKAAVAYQQMTGTKVVLNLAGSDTLATQLIEGAPVDLLISADVSQMDRVEHLNRIKTETRVDLLSNGLTIVVPTDRLNSVMIPEDLRRFVVRRIALGDPNAVPAGVYAKEYLESIGIWLDVRDKIVPTRDVRAALAAVEAGNVDAAIVYRTDISLATDALIAVEVPIQEGPVIRYPAAIVRDAKNDASADRFLAYLWSNDARQIFQRSGFIVLGKGGCR